MTFGHLLFAITPVQTPFITFMATKRPDAKHQVFLLSAVDSEYTALWADDIPLTSCG